MSEVWADARGLEGRVQVSNLGNARGLPYTANCVRKGASFSFTRPAAILRPCVEKHGYRQIAIATNGKRKKYLVHRLVAFAFVPGHEPGLSVNHINGDKLDNRAENLEWLSLADNTRHQWRTGLVDLRGERQPGSKLTAKQVLYIRRLLRQGVPAHTLAVIAGVNPTTVYYIRDGVRWNWLSDDDPSGEDGAGLGPSCRCAIDTPSSLALMAPTPLAVQARHAGPSPGVA